MENAGALPTDQLRVSRIRLANLYGFAAVQARLASYVVKARLFDLWMIVTIFQLVLGLCASLACVMYKGSSFHRAHKRICVLEYTHECSHENYLTMNI
jgi:hypothetical protein